MEENKNELKQEIKEELKEEITKETKKSNGLFTLFACIMTGIIVFLATNIGDKAAKVVDPDTKGAGSKSNVNSKLVEKVDSNKEWVYDANYEVQATVESYAKGGQTYYAKDLKVAYINVKSAYANSANETLRSIYHTAHSTFNKGANGGMEYVHKCEYNKYLKDTSLSVVQLYSEGATDVPTIKYYTYNVNLKNGEGLSYKDVYTLAGIKDNEIDTKVEAAITKVMKEKTANYTSEYYGEGENFDTYNNKSISNYKASVSNNNIQYFLDSNGKLNVIVTLELPVGVGEFDTIITVE